MFEECIEVRYILACLVRKRLVFSFCNSIPSNCFQHMSLVVHTSQELAFGKDVFKMSSLYRSRGRCAGGGGGRGGGTGTTFRAPD